MKIEVIQLPSMSMLSILTVEVAPQIGDSIELDGNRYKVVDRVWVSKATILKIEVVKHINKI